MLKNKPKVIELFADDSSHSHFALVGDNGETIWEESGSLVKTKGDQFCIREQVYQHEDPNQPGIAGENIDHALPTNEEQYRKIFQNSIVGMFQTTPEGRFINLNIALAKIFGYDSPKELMSNIQNIQRQIYVNPKDRDSAYELVEKNGFLKNYEVQCRHVSGSIIWIAVNIHKVTDGQDRTLYNEGSVQDITERKWAEDALRQSEEKFRNLFNNAEVGMFRTRLDGSAVLDVNNKYLSILGLTHDDNIIGKSSNSFWADLNEREEIIKKLTAQGRVDNFECRLIRKDGAVINCLTSMKLYPEPKGGKLEGSIVDVTERKRLQEELARSEALMSTAIENLPIIFYMIDRNGMFRLSIGAGLKGLGLEQNQVVGQSAFDIYKEFPEITDSIHRSLGGEKVHFESHVAGSSYLNICVPFSDQQGGFAGIVAVALDITERRRMEEELQKSQKLEALGLLAGGIAHDFNNLMGGIFGYIDIASEETKESNVTSYLSKAMNTIDRARALTRQLLTFAKGGGPVQQIGNLFPFVQETATFALSGANVSCHFEVPQDLWACNFDKNQIGQVIDNLIINAQQAMPVGGTIELSARNITLAEKEHPILSKGNYIKISVKDCGIGIPKELIAKIFDPFFTTKATGHGLGLATCYSIVKKHEGCIDVESEPGKGSTFKVYLPASSEAAPEETLSIRRHKGTGTIIVMDDEEVIRTSTRKMLEIMGYNVVCKNDGKAVLDFFASETGAGHKFAGMLFDLTIPGGMGGIEAVAEIRKLGASGPQLPVIVLSGYSDDPAMKNPGKYGFSASLSKPFTMAELSEMLNSYFKNLGK